MSGLIVAFIVFVTVLLVLAVGVGSSYLAASTIFRLMAQRPEEHQTAALTTAEAGSGD